MAVYLLARAARRALVTQDAVLLAASLCAQAIRKTRETGLATYSATPNIIHPGVGEGHLWQILRVLALVNADGTTPLATTLHDIANIASSGSTAVIITANEDGSWIPSLLEMARQGIQAHVILLDRLSFGGDGNTLATQDAIRQLGFAADIIHQGDVGEPLEERKTQGFWEFKVTPHGRVITVHNPDEGARR